MIYGAHFLLYSVDPAADRKFFRDVLKLKGVDAGEGWLIFALPPAEVAVHPIEDAEMRSHSEPPMLAGHLYLMCDDLAKVVATLKSMKVKYSAIQKAPWGKYTTLRMPSGGHVGLYQPAHPIAFKRKRA
jgi:hypothetical protein